MNREEKLKLRELHLSANPDQRHILEEFYPELKDSEGERIRRALINEIKTMNARYSLFDGIPKDRFIAWLEQQGEQKDIVNNQSDYVDLGLPSGTLWAKCNLGAEKETDFGKFFQWGDTQGYKIDEHQFSWNDYKFGIYDSLTKYNRIDGKLILDSEDDPVFVATNGRFKMPTKEQLRELIDCTNHEWVRLENGVNGMKFTNKNDETKYIFIPAADCCYDGNHFGVGSYGNVWSASRYESYADDAWCMDFYAGGVSMFSDSRYIGYSVRGVLNK